MLALIIMAALPSHRASLAAREIEIKGSVLHYCFENPVRMSLSSFLPMLSRGEAYPHKGKEQESTLPMHSRLRGNDVVAELFSYCMVPLACGSRDYLENTLGVWQAGMPVLYFGCTPMHRSL